MHNKWTARKHFFSFRDLFKKNDKDQEKYKMALERIKVSFSPLIELSNFMSYMKKYV